MNDHIRAILKDTEGIPNELIVLTREEAAILLKIHPTSIGKIAGRADGLRCFRTGPQDGTPRTTLADVLEYINRKRDEGKPTTQKLPANHHARRKKLHAVPSDNAEPWDAA